MSDLVRMWFSEAKKLQIDQAILFRVANKSEQIELANAFEAERKVFASIDPVIASQLFIRRILKDRHQYVVIERKYRTPFTAFLQHSTGGYSKVTIDPERFRMIKLMLKDKKSKSEIEVLMEGLTENEIMEFFP